MKLRAALFSSLFLALVPQARAQTLLQEWTGAAEGDQLGSVVAGVGDADGDGMGDVAARVGGAAEVQVFSGATGALLRTFPAENASDNFGAAISGAGDVDGDGMDDVVIGAPQFDTPAGADAGKVYVYNVATGALIRAIADGGAGERVGVSIAGLGDANGDGDLDIAAGAPDFDLLAPVPPKINVGRVLVYNALTGARVRAFVGQNADDRFGTSVARVGNVNNMGGVDFAVGAPNFDGIAGMNTGKAYVYDAGTGALVGSLTGSDAGSHLGASVSGAGDANGDGRDDVVAAAPNFDGPAGSQAGRVYLWSPATITVLHAFDGEEEFGEFGSSAAGAGDVDGDGDGDVVVGCRAFHGSMPFVLDRGKAYVYSGASGALLASVLGTHGEDGLGSSVAGTGDANGDGRDDVVLGAILADGPAGQATGKAYLYSVLPPGPTCSPVGAGGSPLGGIFLYAAAAILLRRRGGIRK